MEKINWSKWSSIAEIISSLAIVLTLIYLAVQTQQNTEATLANSRHTIINNDLIIAQAMIDSPVVNTAIYKEILTDDEKVQLQGWLLQLARTREHQWLQYQNGLLDKKTWEAFQTGLTINISYERTRHWWNIVAYAYFDNDFVDVINAQLANIPIVDYVHPMDRTEPL